MCFDLRLFVNKPRVQPRVNNDTNKVYIFSLFRHNDNVEWDFSSDSDIAGNSQMDRPKRRSKALSRNNSITFADRDQVMYEMI